MSLAADIAKEEEAIRSLRFAINTLIDQENGHKKKLAELKGRGGA